MEHSQKTVENTERVRSLTKAAYEQLPEEKTFLEKNRMKVEHLIHFTIVFRRCIYYSINLSTVILANLAILTHSLKFELFNPLYSPSAIRASSLSTPSSLLSVFF